VCILETAIVSEKVSTRDENVSDGEKNVSIRNKNVTVVIQEIKMFFLENYELYYEIIGQIKHLKLIKQGDLRWIICFRNEGFLKTNASRYTFILSIIWYDFVMVFCIKLDGFRLLDTRFQNTIFFA